ncbi:uncharacterized protein LOC117321454 [Pecten maximus]|uniref:uncharacterized protein LOC117315187 n=1 Tax=Pecten maximus TaxID=6579 RepID=UPI0014585F02|nr:uncharacterized protein LOC117315187 [Pecten maximus]XP_033731762.1 uncharacterized protein LOC117321454 [Pecten maximus]
MYRMFMQNQSYEYLSQLDSLTQSINDTPSRPLGNIAPSDVNKSNEEEVRLKAYLVRTKQKWKPKEHKKESKTKKKREKPFYKYKVGDRVRITHLKHPFQREYDQKWTGEVFVIRGRFKRQGLPLYRLEDFDGEHISGTFYSQELQRVNVDENTTWKIDKVIKERKRNGETEVFVSWLHWPNTYNSWIPKKHLQDV